MLKKNNFISIKDFCSFGVNKKILHKVYRKFGINPRVFKIRLKNGEIFKVKKFLEKGLTGGVLKKRHYQLHTFSSKLKNLYNKV